MSVVTGITLQISCAEDNIEQDNLPDIVLLINKINEWLIGLKFQPLAAVTQHYGGSKHPQVLVYGAGYNYFPENEFENFIMTLPWKYPEQVVLLVNPEEGPTKVLRLKE